MKSDKVCDVTIEDVLISVDDDFHMRIDFMLRDLNTGELYLMHSKGDKGGQD